MLMWFSEMVNTAQKTVQYSLDLNSIAFLEILVYNCEEGNFVVIHKIIFLDSQIITNQFSPTQMLMRYLKVMTPNLLNHPGTLQCYFLQSSIHRRCLYFYHIGSLQLPKQINWFQIFTLFKQLHLPGIISSFLWASLLSFKHMNS